MNFIFSKKHHLTHEETAKKSNRFMLKSDFGPRFFGNLLLIMLIFSFILIVMIFRDHIVSDRLHEWHTEILKFTSSHGFGIQDIIIEGRNKTTLDALNQKILLNRKNSIFEANLPLLKDKIEDLPWVEKAELKRSFFPNILQVRLKEKDIIALYQTEGNFYPVDQSGRVLWVDYTPTKPFLVIVGEGAPAKLFELFKVLSSNSTLFAHIRAAVLYSGRRWDLVFDDSENGITVRMPEENFDKAYKKLIKFHNKYGIFKRKLTIIDLRYRDKTVITPIL